MNFKILIPMLAIVLVAGCTIPDLGILGAGTSLVGGNGLSVTSFTAEPSPVYSGNTVRVTVEAQNLGGTTVGVGDSLLYLTGTDVNLADTSGSYWYGSATSDQTPIKHFNKNMTTANVVKGTSAVTDRVIWNLKAPTIPSGQTRQDTFILRVYSKYSSGVNGNIWIYSESESEATKSAGRTLHTSSFTPITGPIAVSVKLSPDPVVLYAGESTFSFDITLTNTATGSIYNKDINYASAGVGDLALDSETELNHVTVTVDSGTLTLDTECVGDKQILGGKSLTLTCTATVPSADTLTFQSFPMNVMVGYGYYTENEATVTIQGK